MSLQSSKRIAAFASGTVVPIESVPDPVFAGRMMGDGVAIDPIVGALYAPCDGRVTQVHAARHACILETDDGARMLLHIGIDTVLLKGEGFVARVAAGDRVRQSQVLIEFDIAVLRRHNKPLITMLVVENGDDFRICTRSAPRTISVGESLLTLEPINAPSTAALLEARDLLQDDDEGKDSTENANGWATIHHAGGLHARPCALLANAVEPYAAAVSIVAHGKTANARSATAVMGLAIAEGEEIELRASGKNAGDALEAALDAARRYWLHVATGEVAVGERLLAAGAALGLVEEGGALALRGLAEASDVLLFDLPA